MQGKTTKNFGLQVVVFFGVMNNRRSLHYGDTSSSFIKVCCTPGKQQIKKNNSRFHVTWSSNTMCTPIPPPAAPCTMYIFWKCSWISIQTHSPILGDKVDYVIGLSSRPASQCSLTCRYTTTLCHSQLYPLPPPPRQGLRIRPQCSSVYVILLMSLEISAAAGYVIVNVIFPMQSSASLIGNVKIGLLLYLRILH